MNNSRKIDGSLNVIGNKIKYYREKNKLSYQKLSDKLMLLGIDIHKQAIYNIEVAKNKINKYWNRRSFHIRWLNNLLNGS